MSLVPSRPDRKISIVPRTMPVSNPTSVSEETTSRTSSSDEWTDTGSESTTTESASLLSGETELGAPSKYREQRAQMHELAQHLIHLGGLISDIGRTIEQSEKSWHESEQLRNCDVKNSEAASVDDVETVKQPAKDLAVLTALGECAEGYAEFKLRRFRKAKRRQRTSVGEGELANDEQQEEGEKADTFANIFSSVRLFPSMLIHQLLRINALEAEKDTAGEASGPAPPVSLAAPTHTDEEWFYPSMELDAKAATKALRAELAPFLSALQQGSEYLTKLSSAFPDPFSWFTTDPAIGDGIEEAERARKNFHRHLKDALEGTDKKDPRMVMDSAALEQIQHLAQSEEDLQQLYWEAAQNQRLARHALTTCAEHLRLYNELLSGAQILERKLHLESQSLARAAVLHQQAYQLGKEFFDKYRSYVKRSKRKRGREIAVDEASA